jgi:type VI secretion system protein ImpC
MSEAAAGQPAPLRATQDPETPRREGADAEPSALELSVQETLDRTGLGRNAADRAQNAQSIGAYLEGVSRGTIGHTGTARGAIKSRIAEIDRLLSGQLNAIMHDESFQKLEAAWRGLQYMLRQVNTGKLLQVKLLDVSKEELRKDLAVDKYEYSRLFELVHKERFDQLGADPFGAFIGDFEFDRSPQDIELLSNLSHVAAAVHAPFLTAASPDMFGLESFTELNNPRELEDVFQGARHVSWRSFRESEDSRYVALTLPHVLMRRPYGRGSVQASRLNFEEDVDGTDHGKYLWGNAAWALGTRVAKAFDEYGWCARIRGVESGGQVEGLPTHAYETGEGDVALKCPTEIPIPMRREQELANLGFAPLVYYQNTDKAVFLSVQSAQAPGNYGTSRPDQATATGSANLAAQIPYVFAVSRFAHYLQAILRQKIGEFTSREKLQADLKSWIVQYVEAQDNAGEEVKARKPLRDADVEVREVAGRPGVYEAIALLRPHFQLDSVQMSLRLVADVNSEQKR